MIQWFPGHMHSTRKAIAECMPEIDVTIEMLDARLPGSSANPMLVALTSHKPALKILNKADLADPVQTEGWLAHYRAMPQTQAIALDAGERAPMAQIKQSVQALAPNRGSLGGTLSKPLRVLIGGIPNVGKSTLINTLTGKRAAKTGDEAGVTRLIQRIVLEDGFYLFDSPGVLWPKIAVEQSGVNLAATGAIGKNAYEDVDVALSVLAYLKLHYAALLTARYGVAAPQDLADEDLLAAVGRKRAPLRTGNKVDLQKAAEIVIHDLRTGTLGRITLETVPQFSTWQQEALAAAEASAAAKLAQSKRTNKRKK